MKVAMVQLSGVVKPATRVELVDNGKSYTMIGISANGKGIFNKEPALGATISARTVRRIEPGDLIYSRLFAWRRSFALADESAHASGEFPAFHIDTSRANPRFLLHALLSDHFTRQVNDVSTGTTTASRYRLAEANFLKLRIPLPSLPNQEHIAAYLDSLESVTRVISNRMPAVDMRAELPRLLGDLLRSHHLPVVPLHELCHNRQTVIHPGQPLQGADRFVGLEHIESHTGRSDGGRSIGGETGRKLLFSPGTVTYGYLRPYLNKVWAADSIGLCSVEQFVLVPEAGVPADLLSVVLRSDDVWLRAMEATNSLQLPRLSLSILMTFPVPDVRKLSSPQVLADSGRRITEHVSSIALARERQRGVTDSLLSAARNAVFGRLDAKSIVSGVSHL